MATRNEQQSLDSFIQQTLQQEVQTKRNSQLAKKRKQQNLSEFELQQQEDDEITTYQQTDDTAFLEQDFKEQYQEAQFILQQKLKKQKQADLEEDNQNGGYEEEGEVYEDEVGCRIEPFNLKEERARGYFDAAGNYVEHAGKDDDDEDAVRDPWLDFVEVMSAQQVEKIKKQIDDREIKDVLEMNNPKKLYSRIASILKEEETVPAALRRLKKENNKTQLLTLTELADGLMRSGETDVYTFTQRQFQAEAKIALDDDDDMFADNGQDNKVPPHQNSSAQLSAEQTDPQLSSRQLDLVSYPHIAILQEWFRQQQSVDYSSWPTKELVRLLKERGVSSEGAIEREELVQQVKQVLQQDEMNAPPGFVFDPNSKYFWNGELQMYFEPTGQYFCSGQNGYWYVFDVDKCVFCKIEA